MIGNKPKFAKTTVVKILRCVAIIAALFVVLAAAFAFYLRADGREQTDAALRESAARSAENISALIGRARGTAYLISKDYYARQIDQATNYLNVDFTNCTSRTLERISAYISIDPSYQSIAVYFASLDYLLDSRGSYKVDHYFSLFENGEEMRSRVGENRSISVESMRVLCQPLMVEDRVMVLPLMFNLSPFGLNNSTAIIAIHEDTVKNQLVDNGWSDSVQYRLVNAQGEALFEMGREMPNGLAQTEVAPGGSANVRINGNDYALYSNAVGYGEMRLLLAVDISGIGYISSKALEGLWLVSAMLFLILAAIIIVFTYAFYKPVNRVVRLLPESTDVQPSDEWRRIENHLSEANHAIDKLHHVSEQYETLKYNLDIIDAINGRPCEIEYDGLFAMACLYHANLSESEMKRVADAVQKSVPDIEYVFSGEGGWLYYVMLKDEETSLEAQTRLRAALDAPELEAFDFALGVSEFDYTFSELANARTECVKCVSEASVRVGGKLRTKRDRSLSAQSLAYADACKKILDLIYKEQFQAVDECLDSFFKASDASGESVSMFRRSVLGLITALTNCLKSNRRALSGGAQSQVDVSAARAAQSWNAQAITQYLIEISEAVLDEIPESNRMESFAGQVIAYIQENYVRDITASDAGEFMYMNPDYLNSMFKKQTGYTFKSYLDSVRIEKAKQALVDSRDGIAAVGARVGIATINTFIRLFKKYVGVTPSAYRHELCLRESDEDE